MPMLKPKDIGGKENPIVIEQDDPVPTPVQLEVVQHKPPMVAVIQALGGAAVDPQASAAQLNEKRAAELDLLKTQLDQREKALAMREDKLLHDKGLHDDRVREDMKKIEDRKKDLVSTQAFYVQEITKKNARTESHFAGFLSVVEPICNNLESVCKTLDEVNGKVQKLAAEKQPVAADPSDAECLLEFSETALERASPGITTRTGHKRRHDDQ